MENVDFVFNNNTYLCINETDSMRQVIGISTGTNGAPEIATITVYANELAYMDS